MPRLASVTGGFAGFASLGISLAPPAQGGGGATIGLLFSAGNNDFGYFGNNATVASTSPVQAGALSWQKISAGINTSLAIRSDGLLFGWGRNSYGQVGDGTYDGRSSPVQIGSSSWIEVSAGDNHSAAIRDDGVLFTWGLNRQGCLGINQDYNYTGAVSWTAVATGLGNQAHTLAVRSDGKLFAWGNNYYGQLGNSTTSFAPGSLSPVQIGTSNWTAVAAGAYASYAVRSDGTLWSWGSAFTGGLGLGTGFDSRSSPVQIGSATNWSKVFAGNEVAFATDTMGQLYAWGDNTYGQVVHNVYGSSGHRSSPAVFGPGGTQSGWTKIAIGYNNHVVGIRNSNLYSWGGTNANGERGYNNTTANPAFAQIGFNNDWNDVAVGNSHTMAIRSQGTIYAWGANNHGQLGLNDVVNRSSPVQVGSVTNWTRIRAKGTTTYALDFWGRRWLIGGKVVSTDAGNTQHFPSTSAGAALTYYRSSPVQLGASKWLDLTIASVDDTYNNVLLDQSGRLFQWGSYFSLPSAPSTPAWDPTPFFNIEERYPTPEQVGRTVTAQTFTAGSAYNFGSSGNGFSAAFYGTSEAMNTKLAAMKIGETVTLFQTSIGTYTRSLAESSYSAEGGEGGYWSLTFFEDGLPSMNNITSITVDAQSPPIWTKVSANEGALLRHGATVAIRSDGTLWGWGNNHFKQLVDSSYEKFNHPRQISSTTGWKAVSAAERRIYAINGSDLLFGIGNNASSLLGDGTSINRSSPVQIGSGSWNQISAHADVVVGVTSANQLFSWGNYISNKINGSSFKSIHNAAYYSSFSYASDIGFVGVTTAGKLLGLGMINAFFPNGTYSEFLELSPDTDWAKAHTGYYGVQAIKTNGTLWSTGFAETTGTGQQHLSSFVQVGSSTWSDVQIGGTFGAAVAGIQTNGTLWHWGTGPNPGSGSATTTPSQVGSATNWTKLSIQGGGKFVINSLGQLWGWSISNGNVHGALGNNSTSNSNTLVQIPGSWSQVSSGNLHTLGIKADGTLWSWGSNQYGQLGQNSSGFESYRSSPVQIGSGTNWAKVFAGYDVSFAIDNSGKLWALGGYNLSSGLGVPNGPGGGENYRSSPVQVGTDNWDTISPDGPYTVYALKTNPGPMFVWGSPGNFPNLRFGNGTQNSTHIPSQTGFDTTPTYTTPTQVIGSTGLSWKSAVTNGSLNLAVTTNNVLYYWGNDGDGASGKGQSGWATDLTNSGRSNVLQIVLGYNYSNSITS